MQFLLELDAYFNQLRCAAGQMHRILKWLSGVQGTPDKVPAIGDGEDLAAGTGVNLEAAGEVAKRGQRKRALLQPKAGQAQAGRPLANHYDRVNVTLDGESLAARRSMSV
jgi:hypothetical protein